MVSSCFLQTIFSEEKGITDVRYILTTFYDINPFSNKPLFLLVCSTSLLKTLREKEKLLVMGGSGASYKTGHLQI